MSIYLIPTTDEFVEDVAKAISRSRFWESHYEEIKLIAGQDFDPNDPRYYSMPDELWASTGADSDFARSVYRKDALAAIGAINLKLMTTTE